ncbi:putative signal transducing protein [Sphingomonas oryzagri]
MALVEIETFPNAMIAEMARARLAAEGIEAVLFDGGVASIGLGGLMPARLMVPEADEALATKVLAQAD